MEHKTPCKKITRKFQSFTSTTDFDLSETGGSFEPLSATLLVHPCTTLGIDPIPVISRLFIKKKKKCLWLLSRFWSAEPCNSTRLRLRTSASQSTNQQLQATKKSTQTSSGGIVGASDACP